MTHNYVHIIHFEIKYFTACVCLLNIKNLLQENKKDSVIILNCKAEKYV